MKKESIALLISILLFYSLQSPAKGKIRIGLKPAVSASYFSGGELNRGLQGWSDIWKTYLQNEGYTNYKGGYVPLNINYGYGLDILVEFNRRISVSFGSGLLYSKKSSDLSFETENGLDKFTWNPELKIIPITLSLNYYPVSKKTFKLYIFFGPDYYIANYFDKQHIAYLNGIDEEYKLKSRSFGAHGGIGVEFLIAKNIGLFLEGSANYAIFNSLKGSVKQTWANNSANINGDLWYCEINAFGSGPFPIITVEESMPESPDLINVRQAKLNLNSPKLKLGFIFHF